jgi:hypothetical protein
VSGLGCRLCRPNSFQCSGNDIERCNADGTGFDPYATCDADSGQACNATIGACTNPCQDAASSNSYIGCEYWPVTTSNSQVDSAFLPAIVVANPQSVAADVSITGPGGFSREVTLVPGGTETVELPWVDALKGQIATEASALVTGGAYRVVSSVPVTLYQFNALEYRLPRDCFDAFGSCDTSQVDALGQPVCDGQCFSYSNDASLLLPTHALTPNYLVLGRPSMLTRITPAGGLTQTIGSPGFFAVVGVSEAPVTVTVTFSAFVTAGAGVRAFAPGETGTFTLARGDVLQVIGALPTTCSVGSMDNIGGTRVEYCDAGAQYDLTGTEIRATGPVEVIAGHNCAFVPYDRWACDHLEEALFPLEAWGTESIISRTEAPMGRTEPNLVRIISGRDGNEIRFDPSSVSGARTLNRGEIMEFEASQSFRVTGTEAFMVGQFIVGQDYGGYGTSGDMGQGDPSMSLGIPSEQFRTSYTFLAPSNYPANFVNVTAPAGASVTLDGSPVGGFAPVGGTGFSVARVPVGQGPHSLTGTQPFGIVVYGYGTYTSYMVPGGLDLNAINIPF